LRRHQDPDEAYAPLPETVIDFRPLVLGVILNDITSVLPAYSPFGARPRFAIHKVSDFDLRVVVARSARDPEDPGKLRRSGRQCRTKLGR
jgi:hypothetical protein